MAASVSLPCLAADRASAERVLMEGHVDEAVAALRAMVSSNPKDGPAQLLLCRAFLAEDSIDPAVSACEAAIANGGGSDSRTQDWMGRAYGLKAGHSGAFSGFNLARKVKAAFERAVELDPKNAAAANDLSEYYVNAPGVVGGGTDKALALAASIQTAMPQAAHRIRAIVAEKRKDYGAAEREFRAAAEVAGHADAWTDLGHFYARRGQADAAVTALRKALQADAAKDASLVDVASILSGLHREPQLAEHALRDYLASSARSDAAPAFKAHFQLGQLLQQSGDKAAAKLEYQAALALAAGYAPARKVLQSL